jgi:hypothetical protein
MIMAFGLDLRIGGVDLYAIGIVLAVVGTFGLVLFSIWSDEFKNKDELRRDELLELHHHVQEHEHQR